MLPEEQVRRLCAKDRVDLSLYDIFVSMSNDRDSDINGVDKNRMPLSFGKTLCLISVGDGNDNDCLVMRSQDGELIAKIKKKKLIPVTVVENSPEAITFIIDATKSKFRLSITEASKAIVLY